MKIFFGRINEKQHPTDQFQNGYYHAAKGTSYFGDLNEFSNFNEVSVYVFMIAGNTVELWKADRWGEGGQDLFFTKTDVDLGGMTRAWLAAFKYFYLDSDLIVFTTRRPFKKAFFPIEVDQSFTEVDLLNTETYANSDNYRSIELYNHRPTVISRNMIFYRGNGKWNFLSPDFFDSSIARRFIDNSPNIGKGRPNKDSLLRMIAEANPLPKKYNPDELSLLNVYDVFFCEYGGTIEEEILLDFGEQLFKVSMSPKDIDEESFNYFMEKNLIVVHKDTAGKGTSWEKQGEAFVNKMKIGDYFYLCRGNQRFVTIGRVSSDVDICELDEYGSEGWMQRKFEIVKTSPTDYKYEGANKWWTPNNNSTFIQIDESEWALANTYIFAPYFNVAIKKMQLTDNYSNNKPESKRTILNMAFNTILFGPPGTGKTFNSISYAVAMATGSEPETIIQEAKVDRSAVKNIFDGHVVKGQIVFSTFHQSLSYEDFIEGIKPVEPVSEEEELTYAVEDGIFKRLCTEAAFSYVKQQQSQKDINQALDFSTAFDKLADLVNEKLDNGELLEITTRSGGTLTIESVTSQGNLRIRHPKGERTYGVSKRRLGKVSQAFPDLDSVTNINEQFRSEIGGSNSSAYWAVLNYLRTQISSSAISLTTQIEAREYSYEDKKEIIKSLKPEDYRIDNPNRFVLIIDEINRGNVSQIFGELITLIEDDKRLGKEEGLTATLPYSKENFGVPPNVYLVGTMNTADRSVEALDTALRRRFSFVPMMPEESRLGITKDGINLSAILSTLNTRLRVLKDNDHTIGHAWFWNVNDFPGLKQVFANKVLPLLQEYFYNDYEKLGLLLGDAFFQKQERVSSSIFAKFAGGNGLAGQYEQSWQFELKSVDVLTIDDFKTLEQVRANVNPDETA